MKRLRWPEPFDRQMHEIHNSDDTGLCNRIFHWELAYELTRRNGFQYTIVLEESKWPELKELIELPDTIVSPETINEPSELKKKRIIGNSKAITKEMILKMVETGNFYLDNVYDLHSDFGHMSILDLFGRDYNKSERPLRMIKLKDEELFKMIRDFTWGMVGIHMRRGRGVKYSEYVDTLSDGIKDKFLEYRKKESADEFYIYDFITDNQYFKIIDGILEINPYQKIYISHDLPDDVFEYYEKKYPNNLFSKKYFYDFIKDRYPNTNQTHVKNIVDLFTLSHTNLLIKHPLSTWSEFADFYYDKKSFYFHNDFDIILQNYKIENPIKNKII